MRLLFWLVVLFWTVVMLRRTVRWALRGLFSLPQNDHTSAKEQSASSGSRRLVRDPVCGMHIAEERAIPLRTRGEIVHFCSISCRDRYAGDEQIAANG
jgi:YHS domain-containing protein